MTRFTLLAVALLAGCNRYSYRQPQVEKCFKVIVTESPPYNGPPKVGFETGVKW